MCGIAGIQVAGGRGIEPAVLDRMEAALIHRGPDAQGRAVYATTAILSTRLSIIDIEHGDQPLYAPDGKALVANGEIYNSPEVREAIPDYPYKTRSDCEAIFPLMERHGLDFPQHLRGMYGAAIYDDKSGRLVIARDRFGIKPLYYIEHPGLFAFASEPSALLDAGLVPRGIDADARSELLELKYVTGTRTIFPGIRRVEAGELLAVENGAIVERRRISPFPATAPAAKWPPTWLPAVKTPPKLLDELETVLLDSVRVHLRSDASCCLFFSGGVDSTILALATERIAPHAFQALTVGYAGAEREDETGNALRLASALGMKCDRVEMSAEDFWRLAPGIAAAIDDPMCDPAVLPLYMLAKAAAERKHKVAICGEGSDEMFGGYARYRRATLPNLPFVRRERPGVFRHSKLHAEDFIGWDRPMQAAEERLARQWSNRMQVLMAVDVLERLPNCLLIKLDRALMAHGVEGRTPFLDREVIGFAASLPDGLKSNPRWGKKILRDWLAREFPEAKPYARKRGFDVPLASWMAPRARELARLVAAEPGVAAAFSPPTVEAVFADCARDAQPAWSLLYYALWHAHRILGIDCRGDIADVLSQARPPRARAKPQAALAAAPS